MNKEEKKEIDVLVLLEADELGNKEEFNKLLGKEGFKEIEKGVYSGKSTTTIFLTKTFIFEVFKKSLKSVGFKDARIVFLLNEIAYPPYQFDHKTNEFHLAEKKEIN